MSYISACTSIFLPLTHFASWFLLQKWIMFSLVGPILYLYTTIMNQPFFDDRKKELLLFIVLSAPLSWALSLIDHEMKNALVCCLVTSLWYVLNIRISKFQLWPSLLYARDRPREREWARAGGWGRFGFDQEVCWGVKQFLTVFTLMSPSYS